MPCLVIVRTNALQLLAGTHSIDVNLDVGYERPQLYMAFLTPAIAENGS